MTWLVLEQGGAAILDAGTGEAALALAGQYTGPIHLRLTDLVMPGMSGREVAEQAADFLPRPFTAGALTARVCGLLDR